MSFVLDPQVRRALADRVRYYHELGIYDFYRRTPLVFESSAPASELAHDLNGPSQPEQREEMSVRKFVAPPSNDSTFEILSPKPEQSGDDPISALRLIREDLGRS